MPGTPRSRERALLGKMLVELREKRGMPLSRLAALLDQTVVTVRKWESGRAAPDLVELREICEILGVSHETFIRRLERELEKLK
jgi:transcriptional regulator with XRE-family HTH domain